MSTANNYKPRTRSLRNKLVTVLTTLATTAVTVEQTVPGVVPPGTGIMAGQVLGVLAVLVNQFMPDRPKVKKQQ